jgi:hypothetical protein
MTLLIPILATIAIRFAAALSTTGRIWGVNHLAYFSVPFGIACAVLFLALFAFLVIAGRATAVDGGLRRTGLWFQRRSGKIPRPVRLVLVSAALLALFAAFGDETHVLGDGALRLKQMREVGLTDAFRTIVPEPIDYVLHYALDRYGAAPLELSTLVTFRVLSYLAGLFFFWTAWAIASRFRPQGSGTGFTFCYLLCWGGSMMFFGYVEEYAIAAAGMLLFYYLGMKYLESRRGLLPLASVFLVCFFLHNFAIVLLPSLVYAAYMGRSRGAHPDDSPQEEAPGESVAEANHPPAGLSRGNDRRLFLMGVTLLLVACWMVIVVIKRSAGTLLLPASISETGYFVWSPAHLADMLNEIFLVSPAFLVLLWLQRGGQRGERPIRTFFWLSGATGLLLLLLADPQLGMARDWDLFSLPLLAFHVALFMGVDWSRVSMVVKSAIIVLSFSATSIWVVLNHDVAKSLQRCESVVGLEGKRARYGFAMLGDYYFLHERYADAERTFSLSLQKQRHHDSYLGLAQAQAELGKETEAVASLEKALELDPTNQRALVLLGRYYYSNGRWREAREVLLRLLRTPEGRNDANLSTMLQKLNERISAEERSGNRP